MNFDFVDAPKINDLPDCLLNMGETLKSDEIDEKMIVFVLTGALSSVVGHLVNDKSEYQKNIFSVNPITVSSIIISDSGTGKSRLCKTIFEPIYEFIDQKRPAYDAAIKKYKLLIKKINSTINFKDDSFEEDAKIPDEPVSPNFLMEDFTIESLSRAYHVGSNHLTIFSEEGGNVISSRAFSKNSINTTLSFFNKIMCGERSIVNTVKDGQRIIVNKRMTLLLLLQNAFFQKFIDNAAGQAAAGTFQRIFPIRAKNLRKKMADKIKSNTDFNYLEFDFFSKCCEIPTPIDNNGILRPDLIIKTEAAQKIWFDYFAEQNDFCALNKDDETVSYRLRNVETVSRYAALFQVGDNIMKKERLNKAVSANNIKKALKFCRYGLQRQIVEFINKNSDLDKFGKVLRYIKKAGKSVTRYDLMRNLPRGCRSVKDVDTSLLFLIEEGLIEKTGDGFILNKS